MCEMKFYTTALFVLLYFACSAGHAADFDQVLDRVANEWDRNTRHALMTFEALSQGKSLLKGTQGPVSHTEFLKTIGSSLPSDLNSLENLQTYAAFYAKERNITMFDEAMDTGAHETVLDTSKRPCIRATHVETTLPESTRMRLQQIYHKAMLLKDPPIACYENPWADVYFSLAPKNSDRKSELKAQFAPFLMVHNRDLFPNYEEVLQTSYQHIKVIKHDSERFIAQIEYLEPKQIAKWMQLAGFSQDEKLTLLKKLRGINSDIAVLHNLLRFMVNNLDSIQVLDMLHYAEQNFDLAGTMGGFVSRVSESGLFFSESNGESTTVVRENFSIGIGYSMKYLSVPRRAEVAKFFSHREFPLRSLAMFAFANATLFRDFANRVRINANLPPVSEALFVQSDFLKETLKINTKLAPVRAMVERQNRRLEIEVFGSVQHKNQLEKRTHNTNAKKGKKGIKKHHQQKNVQRKKAAKSQRATHYELTPVDAQEEERSQVVEAVDEPLGVSVTNLLDSTENELFTRLFAQDFESFSPDSIKTLILSVYRALVDLNEVTTAIQFLKKNSDTRLFESKQGNIDFVTNLKKRLAIFLMLDVVHPSFDKATIIEGDEAIKIQVLAERILFGGKKVRGVAELDQLLQSCEDIISRVASRQDRRDLLINLAYSWHRYARELQEQHSKTSAHVMDNADQKIKGLLLEARKLPRKPQSITVLEAYLMSFYLKIHETPEHKRLTDDEFHDIQAEAYFAIDADNELPSFEMTTIDQDRNELPKTTVRSSIFHAITNSRVDDFVMLKFTKPIKDRKIPLFMTINNIIYRTDVFGGSRLRPDLGDDNYGSLILVSLRAAEFFRHWLTSEESFWYAQRAFMPRSEGVPPQSLHGELRVLTVPDEDNYVINGKFLVHDGFGYIKESVAKRLGLRPLERSDASHKRNVAYQSLQSYDIDMRASKNLFDGLVNRHRSGELEPLSPLDQANGYSPTLPKTTAVGVPIAGRSIMVPNTPQWTKLAKNGTMIGRNPYSSMSLQWIPHNRVVVNHNLNSFRAFQYTLTGLYPGYMDMISGSFFKGLLGVISDKDWPAELNNIDLVVSSKDEKLNQAWLEEADKDHDQARTRRITMHGVLYVTDDMYKKHVMGLPPELTDKLAGDFDGDEYDALDSEAYPDVVNMAIAQSGKAIANPKIRKSFTVRKHEGNYERILALRKPILETANSIQNRFYHLRPSERVAFAVQMGESNLLNRWLEPKVACQFVDFLDIVTAEIQLMIKFGEDIFKTKVDSNQVMQRARAYEQALDEYKSARAIPYGSGLRKKIVKGVSVKDAMNETLTTKKSGNVVDKAARAFARYLNDDDTYASYLSDEDDGDECGDDEDFH